jgi:hypothetical protein
LGTTGGLFIITGSGAFADDDDEDEYDEKIENISKINEINNTNPNIIKAT